MDPIIQQSSLLLNSIPNLIVCIKTPNNKENTLVKVFFVLILSAENSGKGKTLNKD